jgi:hypothetical protein
MTKGNRSALRAVRIGLLAGFSGAALLMGMAAAQAADNVTVTGGDTGAVTQTATGTLQGNGVDITGLGVTDGTNTSTLSTTGLGVTDGTATSSVTATGITSGGTLTSAGELTVTTGGADITGGTATDTLTVTGLSTFGTTGNTTIGANGDVAVGGTLDVTGNSTFAGTTTTTGLATFNGGATVNGTTTLSGVTNFGTSGDTSISAAGNYTTTNGNITTTNGTITGAAVHATSSLAVSNGATVDMGDNVVHGVATPIVGTDATNKAYVDRAVNKGYEGTALALAISQPVFMPGQSFAMRAGWGSFEDQNAFGVSAAGVIARNVLGYGSTVVVDAGIGAGSNYNTVAGKAGVTFGFGGGNAPLK